MFWSKLWHSIIVQILLQASVSVPQHLYNFVWARLSCYHYPVHPTTVSSCCPWTVMSLFQQSCVGGWGTGQGYSKTCSWGLTQGGSTNSHMLRQSGWPMERKTAVCSWSLIDALRGQNLEAGLFVMDMMKFVPWSHSFLSVMPLNWINFMQVCLNLFILKMLSVL